MSTIREAMLFAMDRHSDQRRKYTNEFYWKHLAEVVAIVASVSWVTDEMLMAAWLHDVVEDTDTNIDEVRNKFGLTVARLVDGLSDVSTKEDGNRAARKAIDRAHLAQGCALTQTIKCADVISNGSSVAILAPDFAKVYLPEKVALLKVLKKADVALLALAKKTVDDALASLNKSE